MPRGPEQPNFYHSLGVPKDATREQIKKRYRQHAQELHPDVNPDPKAQERLKEINEAYETLSDPKKRTIYDSRLRQRGTIFNASEQPTLRTLSDLLVLYVISKAVTGLENLMDRMQKPQN
jgi:DnaJ-class molecular chaperone